jgi:hypothetical protein
MALKDTFLDMSSYSNEEVKRTESFPFSQYSAFIRTDCFDFSNLIKTNLVMTFKKSLKGIKDGDKDELGALFISKKGSNHNTSFSS